MSVNQCEVLSAGGGKADTFDINTVEIGNPVKIFSIDYVTVFSIAQSKIHWLELAGFPGDEPD